ncbi:MAG: DUF4339 domain-containing protein [Chthoniobacterales bacterium]
MTIFISRDGDMIGEFPHHQLEAMARAGRLRPDDDYWHEGMGEWSTLDKFIRRRAWEPVPESVDAEADAPSPAPPFWQTMDRRVLIGGGAALLGLILLVGFLVVEPSATQDRTAVQQTLQPNAPTALEIRDKAAANLRERIERLPATAKPPLNTFYYDVRVAMNKSYSERTPWSATVHGFENAVDPEGKALSRTEFILTTDYDDGEWIFKKYHASVHNLAKDADEEIQEGENSPIPPSLVEALGLKRRGTPVNPPAIATPPAGETSPITRPPPLIGKPADAP